MHRRLCVLRDSQAPVAVRTLEVAYASQERNFDLGEKINVLTRNLNAKTDKQRKRLGIPKPGEWVPLEVLIQAPSIKGSETKWNVEVGHVTRILESPCEHERFLYFVG